MTLAARKPPKSLTGRTDPRIAPPVPARHETAKMRETAAGLGITLMPWQEVAARYLTALGPEGHLYREVCIVVARQNGKTKRYENDCGSGQNQQYESNDQNDATCEKHDDSTPNWRIFLSPELPRY